MINLIDEMWKSSIYIYWPNEFERNVLLFSSTFHRIRDLITIRAGLQSLGWSIFTRSAWDSLMKFGKFTLLSRHCAELARKFRGKSCGTAINLEIIGVTSYIIRRACWLLENTDERAGITLEGKEFPKFYGNSPLTSAFNEYLIVMYHLILQI